MATRYDTPTQPNGTNLTLCSQDDALSGANCSALDLLPSSTSPVVDSVIWTPDVIQRVASLAFIMTLTLIGNTAILVVLTCSRYRKRNSRVNLFIIHLALGDLAVCFCTMTTEILFVAFGQWVLGAVACKLLTYLQIVTLASTTFILTSMSFDRYLAICNPLRRATTCRAKKFIALSWCLAFVFAVPQLFIFVQTEAVREDGSAQRYCKSQGYSSPWQRKAYFSFLTLYILVVPVILITFCYASIVYAVSQVGQVVQLQSSLNSANAATTGGLRRSGADNSTFPRAKIKTLKMTFAIITTFVLCWTPYFVTTLIRVYSDYSIHIPPSVMAFAETVALLQSALNPLLYGCFTVKIKRGLADVCCRKSRVARPRWAVSHHQHPLKSGAAVGVTECYSMTELGAANGFPDRANCVGPGANPPPAAAPAARAGLRDGLSDGAPNTSSSSGGGGVGTASCGCRVITVENRNGVRLRVRFATPNKDLAVAAASIKLTDKTASASE